MFVSFTLISDDQISYYRQKIASCFLNYFIFNETLLHCIAVMLGLVEPPHHTNVDMTRVRSRNPGRALGRKSGLVSHNPRSEIRR